MKTLKIIKDADIGSELPEVEVYKERKASRAVVFDTEGNIALIYAGKNNYHKLPGGGVDKEESLEAAVRRELMEEIGCKVENVKELGIVEEYRNKIRLHQISYCYTAQVVEKGIAQLEANEIAEEYVTKWLTLDTAIEILDKEKDTDHYDGKFMWLRDLVFLREARKQHEQK